MLRIATDVPVPVRLTGLAPEMVLGAQIVSDVFAMVGGADAIITSATDGRHSVGSLHHCGRALDFRTREIAGPVLERVVAAVRKSLGPDFDVILEGDHLHVEYDPK